MTARILVVDDIAANVRLLEAKLMAEYFEVVTASDGPSALEIAAKQSPDIILLDVMMPGMDGFEVARRLKADPVTRHIPIVMVTALTDTEDRVRGLEAGADDFLSKPINDVALFARVRSLARLKVMMDELRLRHETSDELDFGEESSAAEEGDEPGHIVLVEAADFLAEKLIGYLGDAGHTVTRVTTGAEALAAAQDRDTDLFIVALRLGAEDGLRLCSQLRSHELTRHVPILLMLDDGELQELAKGLDLGVTDYLIRPIDRNELRARVRTQVRRRRYHDRLRNMLETSVSLAYVDGLTGVYNRRYMNAHLDRKIMEIGEGGRPVSVVMLDIDHFKRVNDTYGHASGDDVLKELASRIRESIRDFDLLVRYGGEEFVLIMPHTAADIAVSVAERLRGCLADRPFEVSGSAAPLPVTASFGVATTSDPNETAESLLDRADQALYQAKANGRNQVFCATVAGAPEAGTGRSAALG